MNDKEQLQHLRHSAAHLLAAAVMELYPHTLRTIGPAIDEGFYYDFDFGDVKISESDLAKIEDKMHELVSSWKGFAKQDVTEEEARKAYADNPYKLELIDEIVGKGEPITFYQSGDFSDLCRGGHDNNPSEDLKYFKLMKLAGAYWRGDEKNKMLTRIYGTAFFKKEELDNYLTMLEEAKKRDHRKIGRDLDLFTFSDLVGSGLPLYTQRGALIRRTLNNYIEELQTAEGYQQVWTPQIAKAELFKRSGHYDKYHEDMFHVKSNYSEEEMYLKPMNCPQHTQIYASKMHSYRDLPIRMTDFAMLYRDERPGELNGLGRTRAFSQDDCHIFCREDQVDAEIDKALEMTKKVMQTLGFSYKYRLSTRDPQHPEKYLGDKAIWDKVEKWAEEIMKRNNIEYFDGPGEAAFYAPKMDLIATDSLGREWQLSTIQIDYVQPERFDLVYTDSDGKEKHPIMIHRAIIGSPERMMMILLEHYAGNLPLWLAPVQVALLPITDKQAEYAQKVKEMLESKGIRVELDASSERLQAKIRTHTLQRVPILAIIGEKEENEQAVAVRTREGEDLGKMSQESFISFLVDKIDTKST